MKRNEIGCAVCGSHRSEILVIAKGNRGLTNIASEHPVVICSDCGLVYLNPQHSEKDYESYYALEDYKPIKIPPEIYLRRHVYRRIQAAYLLDTLRVFRGADHSELRAVDIGCGPGVLLHYLAEAGLHVTGLEASKDAADYAEAMLGLKIIRGSVNAGLLPEKAFDVAISTASIEHFTDPLAVLLEMKRSLKPQGLLYVNTPDLLGMVLKKGEANQFKFVHTYYFTETSLTNLIEKAGFRVIRSWVMPPQLRASAIYPGNYCSGELNIVAINDRASIEPERSRKTESAEEIRRAYLHAKKRDGMHAWIREAARLRPFAKLQSLASKFIKPKPVFDELIASNGMVKTEIFPSLVNSENYQVTP